MIRIAVVDDNEVYITEIKDIIVRYFNEKNKAIKLQCYDKSELLLFDLGEEIKYDIYILDIEMPNYNGIQIAEKIRRGDTTSPIIFITSHLKYSLIGYEYNVFRYIPKSMISLKLVAALDDLVPTFDTIDDKFYLISNSSRYEKVSFKNIYYIYKDGKNSMLVCNDKTSRVRKSLKDVFLELDQERFLFIERGYIVNISHVIKLEANDIYMRDGEILHVGRVYAQDVKLKIFNYWSESKWNI
ncbi:LytTR family DNA-binding domain-containing protein [Anaerocolumna sp. AGMB13020]|uniref:LytR/AlgR family response regulator transcription factor n=1 Tax=Anaerocolumna sp. AGMB13020 TaxID=3081750 RepID=UPI002954DBCB|nr:LytTR family DNA-binding domain-containing protein [Anaerocolumna sp. AGMB13020]WOO38565.1 LytTR family DNA-binding domain-containing protein [Anaerocolumna sp. AGMB13020]